MIVVPLKKYLLRNALNLFAARRERVKNNVLYSAELGESGRHAITIVGYDDNYKGGAFRVLNS